jgi:hypothetical protein
MYKYQIWCESGLLYDSEENSEMIFDDFDEAESEAVDHVQSYFDEAESETEPDEYWYDIEEVA